jgi:hypothetical protein
MDSISKDSSEDPERSEPSPGNGLPVGTAPVVTAPVVSYCSTCDREVTPVGKGQCPICHRWVPFNSGSRKHPVNVARCEQIQQELNKEFPPANVVQRAARKQLAAALERLETTKPGTTEWQRLSTVVKELSDDLCPPTPPTDTRVDNPLASLSFDQLIAQMEEQLGMLRAIRDDAEHEPGLSTADGSYYAHAAGPPSEPPATLAPAPEPRPEPRCAYGCGTLARCAELQATRLDAWRALHFLDPEEVKRRDAEATAVMMRQLRRGTPWDY